MFKPKLSIADATMDLKKMPEYRLLIHRNNQSCISHVDFDIENGPWIAGGACLKWYQDMNIGNSDIDIWFKDEEQFLCVKDTFRSNYREFYSTDNAASLVSNVDGTRIQLIRKQWYDSAQDVIDGFDFTICQIASDGKTAIFGKRTKNDIKNKILHATKANKSAIQRAFKYIAYGYIPDESVTRHIETCEGVIGDFTNHNPYAD